MSTTPVVGAAYSDAVASTGFPAPTFAVTGGALPAGLCLDAVHRRGDRHPDDHRSLERGGHRDQLRGLGRRDAVRLRRSVPTAITGSLGDLPIGDAVTVDLDADGYPAPGWAVTDGALPAGLTPLPRRRRGDRHAHRRRLLLGDDHRDQRPRLRRADPHRRRARTAVVDRRDGPAALLGVAASTTLTADGHPAPTFAVTAGALPAGVTLDPTTGVLAGTPLVTGSWAATVTATNSQGSVDRMIGGHVGDPPSAVTGTLPALVWSSPVAVVSPRAATPLRRSRSPPAPFPPALSLDPTTGAVTGIPTVVGRVSA